MSSFIKGVLCLNFFVPNLPSVAQPLKSKAEKKLNKIKPAAKALKSINLDPTKTAKVLSTGIKVAKKI